MPLLSPIRATWPAHLILLDFIALTILGEGFRSLSSSFFSFLHYPVTSSLLRPNILLNTLFSNTLSLCSSLNPLKAELNPICYLLALLAHHFLQVGSVRVKLLTLRLLMSYIYIYIYIEHLFLMFLDHTQRRSTVGRTPLDE